MFNEFLKTTQDLYRKQETFALAFVVNRQVPSSGKPGDKAVIQKDGTLTGWIGGGCTRGIILKEAANAIRDGKPRLVRISPEAESTPREGVLNYNMTCHSGGTVEIYIEPVVPKPQIMIFGNSQVARALSRIAKAMDYPVRVVARNADAGFFPDADEVLEEFPGREAVPGNTCMVVCTQGDNDEQALFHAVTSDSPYVAFVASRRKANAVFHSIRQMGVDISLLKGVRTPAGLDIGAKLPEEVAVSILAEIISVIRDEEQAFPNEAAVQDAGALKEESAVFINPVCDIPVDKKTAKHIIEYEGVNYYFCCDGCKVSFEKEPEKYAAKLANQSG